MAFCLRKEVEVSLPFTEFGLGVFVRNGYMLTRLSHETILHAAARQDKRPHLVYYPGSVAMSACAFMHALSPLSPSRRPMQAVCPLFSTQGHTAHVKMPL